MLTRFRFKKYSTSPTGILALGESMGSRGKGHRVRAKSTHGQYSVHHDEREASEPSYQITGVIDT